MGEDKFPLKYQNYQPKLYHKKEIKYKKSDSTIKFKNSEIINNKQLLLAKRYTMRNKYHKIDKITDNKEKSNTKRVNKGNSSYKNLKNVSIYTPLYHTSYITMFVILFSYSLIS